MLYEVQGQGNKVFCSCGYLTPVLMSAIMLFWVFFPPKHLTGTNICIGAAQLCYGEMLNYKLNFIPEKL